VDVVASSTVVYYAIHRQSFTPVTQSSAVANTQGVDFTPQADDDIYSDEWYCDAEGNVNMSGGYACSAIFDLTQNVAWLCYQANSAECQSFKFSSTETNATPGYRADFVIENNTNQYASNNNWPDFSPVTMVSDAAVVTGQGTGPLSNWVDTVTDPYVNLLLDWTTGGPSMVDVSVNKNANIGNGVSWNPVYEGSQR